MTGHACPECGGQRPGCACARAADRSAELAAAEDFDPLRIRPYVTLDAHDEAGDPPTTQLRAVQATAGADTGPYGGGAGTYGGDGTYEGAAGPYRPADAREAGAYEAGAYEARTQVIPAYGSDAYGTEPPGHGPDAYGPEGGAHETMPLLLGGTDGSGPGGGRPERPRKRRGALVAVVAAAAVVGTAALAAAVLGGEDPEDRAMVPEVTTSASLNLAVSEEPSPSSSSPKADRTPSRTPSPTTSSPTATPSTASPSATTTTTGPTPDTTATGSPSATGAAPSASGTTAPATSAAPPTAPTSPPRTDAPAGAVLSVGDTGPEVQDLQRRLRYMWVYLGEIDGVYGDEVRSAVASFQGRMWPRVEEPGVYDADTRRKLERETRDMDD
ncbi:peptidoglycan-binding domain-containing protein [Streptomyces hydrogenans]|uniref:peptidoglycan-binding domain-containing protein n=1 Tax=Streptomyces hydrogenans TaxID=1873719 RepID=UPI0035D59EAB